MKTIRQFLFGSILAVFLVGSQSSESQTPGTNSTSGTQSGTQGKQSQMSFRDSNYIRRAAEANLMGARIAQLASQKGGSQEIKTLGQNLEKSHNDNYQQLTQIAQSKGITIPKELNARQKRVYEHFSSLSGTNFDHAMLRYLVRSEESSVKATENEANKGTDTDLKEFAAKSLPSLQNDLQQARTLYAGRTTPEPAGAQPKQQQQQEQPAPTPDKQNQ